MSHTPFSKIVADHIATHFDAHTPFSAHDLWHLCKKHNKNKSVISTTLIQMEQRGQLKRTGSMAPNSEKTRRSPVYLFVPGAAKTPLSAKERGEAANFHESTQLRIANKCALKLEAALNWMTRRRIEAHT